MGCNELLKPVECSRLVRVIERESTMQKMETFKRPRLTIATEKLDALLVDDVAEALEHQLRRQWVQGAPRLHTRTTTEVHYPGRDLAVPHHE